MLKEKARSALARNLSSKTMWWCNNKVQVYSAENKEIYFQKVKKKSATQ